jgi:hypothetical protein
LSAALATFLESIWCFSQEKCMKLFNTDLV